MDAHIDIIPAFYCSFCVYIRKLCHRHLKKKIRWRAVLSGTVSFSVLSFCLCRMSHVIQVKPSNTSEKVGAIVPFAELLLTHPSLYDTWPCHDTNISPVQLVPSQLQHPYIIATAGGCLVRHYVVWAAPLRRNVMISCAVQLVLRKFKKKSNLLFTSSQPPLTLVL